ncbi:MAG TPA: DUF2505 domain-containing protein [Kineosporiaceae bacterium]|nr:DUF2505 domain-containing protein [Kineosporiaceae bacterium]
MRDTRVKLGADRVDRPQIDVREDHVQVSADIRYDADPQRVFMMLVDPQFQEAKCVATGAIEHSVAVRENGDGGATIVSRRSMPTHHVPELVRPFLGRSLELIETQEWSAAGSDGSRTGSIMVEIHGAPVRFSASTALAADGAGTHQPIAGDLKASIPLIGGRIEKASEPAVTAAIRVEQRTGTAWLAEH